MKNRLYIAALFASLFLSGCSDQFLQDKEAYGTFDESIFESETQTNWYINNVFYTFYSGYKSPIQTLVGNFSDDKTKMTEEIGGTINDYINPSVTLVSSDDCPTYYGSKLSSSAANEPYTRIRNCSYVIQYIDDVGSSLSSSFRTEAKGQMYYLRALQYFDLLRTYGGVPLVTTVLNASSSDESSKYPRATTVETVAQIISDLEAAAAALPTSWNESTDYGRPTKGAALAMKSRVLLTYASPLFNTDWDNTANSRWTSALEAGLAAEAELTADGYGLYGSSAKDWANMFLVDNAFCKEAITVQLCSSATSSAINNSWENSIRLTSQGGNGGVKAPKEMIDLFPMADGSKPTVANGYDETLFFLNRDPRFYRTFAFSGCKWGYSDDSDATVWAYRWLDSAGDVLYSDNNQVASPAFVRKMSNPSADNASFSYSGTDIFEYRYAELLLNIAECYAATGDITNCVAYLSKIRARVGIPSDNNYGIGTLSNKYEALAACLYERRIELAYEGKRFWDIQRWMLYNDDATSGNNTCEKLGLTPINGTCRTGNYLKAIEVGTSNTDDPLSSLRSSIAVDPDDDDFETQLSTLATFYKNHFELVDPDEPMDNDDGTAVNIDWKQNYYIFGLPTSVLTTNTWLLQTIGWQDPYGADGTFDYQE
jgi:starch-binding outer membrane protein, SusD/RagB family